ncbi:MAG: hypothetical protein Q8R57_02550 [Bacteroidota bacterium]|nr:hypothetical protein [Bacteroidota bacterium]
MNIELEKGLLLEKIATINSEKLILKLKAILKEESAPLDFWDELHPEIKHEVEEAITEIKEGKFINHEEVMKNYQPWLKK